MEKILEVYKNYDLIHGPLKVERIQVLEGANYFSAGPVVLIRIDLGEYDEVFTNQIPYFPEQLEKLIPSLYEHHCSVGQKGGFLFRLNEGTLLGHVIEHVAIELQTLAGMDVGYGKTRSTMKQGVYNIVVRFFDDIAGIYAAKAAVNIISSILTNKPFDVNEIIENLINIREIRLPGPSTQAILDIAKQRNIPFLRLDPYNLMQLGTGKYQKRIRATLTSDTNFIAVETAGNKYLTNRILYDAGIPVPEILKAEDTETVLAYAQEKAFALVINANKESKGKLAVLNISSAQEIIHACTPIINDGDSILVQKYVEGKTYRLLIINYKFVAAGLLIPPSITGDGVHTVEQLIDIQNSNPERQSGDKGKLSKILLDDDTNRILRRSGLSKDSVLIKDKTVFLKNSGNLKHGGSSEDVTDLVNFFNIFLAERAAKIIGLNVAGIDVVSNDISVPLNQNGGVIIGINAAPDFRMHLKPFSGKSINVANNLMDMLFPKEQNTRVPVISVTGSAGKTTMVCFLNYCLTREEKVTGLTSSNGLYIDNIELIKGNMTGSEHVALVLKDPTIDCAILETSRESILNRGLGYQYADIGVVLNIHDTDVGIDDIKYIEDLAYAKSVVAEEVYETGFSVLNADDEMVMDVITRLYSKPVLFSASNNNQAVKASITKGNTVVFIEEQKIVLVHRSTKNIITTIEEIPFIVNFSGKHIIDVILASVGVLAVFGVQPEKISTYLKEYMPAS